MAKKKSYQKYENDEQQKAVEENLKSIEGCLRLLNNSNPRYWYQVFEKARDLQRDYRWTGKNRLLDDAEAFNAICHRAVHLLRLPSGFKSEKEYTLEFIDIVGAYRHRWIDDYIGYAFSLGGFTPGVERNTDINSIARHVGIGGESFQNCLNIVYFLWASWNPKFPYSPTCYRFADFCYRLVLERNEDVLLLLCLLNGPDRRYRYFAKQYILDRIAHVSWQQMHTYLSEAIAVLEDEEISYEDKKKRIESIKEVFFKEAKKYKWLIQMLQMHAQNFDGTAHPYWYEKLLALQAQKVSSGIASLSKILDSKDDKFRSFDLYEFRNMLSDSFYFENDDELAKEKAELKKANDFLATLHTPAFLDSEPEKFDVPALAMKKVIRCLRRKWKHLKQEEQVAVLKWLEENNEILDYRIRSGTFELELLQWKLLLNTRYIRDQQLAKKFQKQIEGYAEEQQLQLLQLLPDSFFRDDRTQFQFFDLALSMIPHYTQSPNLLTLHEILEQMYLEHDALRTHEQAIKYLRDYVRQDPDNAVYVPIRNILRQFNKK